jgi:hypothetical protein
MTNEKGRGGSLGTGSGKAAGRATGGTKAGSSAGGRHGSASTDKTGSAVSGLQESSGEFRVGEGIIFGMRNGNVLIRHSPQGDEVEVGEATLAGLMVDVFFTDKFGGKNGDYPPINKQG